MSRPPALSASRAKEYLQCPLKFRYSVVDSIPQPPTEATVKGNVVHRVLEKLFELPAASRTVTSAKGLLPAAWKTILGRDPLAAELFATPQVAAAGMADTETLIEGYFGMEHPQNLAPKRCEDFVEVSLASGLRLRGIVDRIDEAPDGALRVIDYKTGRAPSPRFINDALFQMRFYALMLKHSWRLPKRMQLLYLRTGSVLTLDPDPRDVEAFEGEVNELWSQIESDARAQSFLPRTSRLCDWCAYQKECPAFGGSVPAMPEEGLERLLAIRQTQPDRQ